MGSVTSVNTGLIINAHTVPAVSVWRVFMTVIHLFEITRRLPVLFTFTHISMANSAEMREWFHGLWLWCWFCAVPQASSIENKQDWIKHIREVIQERTAHLRGALKEPIHIPKTTTAKHKGRRWEDQVVHKAVSTLRAAQQTRCSSILHTATVRVHWQHTVGLYSCNCKIYFHQTSKV